MAALLGFYGVLLAMFVVALVRPLWGAELVAGFGFGSRDAFVGGLGRFL